MGQLPSWETIPDADEPRDFVIVGRAGDLAVVAVGIAGTNHVPLASNTACHIDSLMYGSTEAGQPLYVTTGGYLRGMLRFARESSYLHRVSNAQGVIGRWAGQEPLHTGRTALSAIVSWQSGEPTSLDASLALAHSHETPGSSRTISSAGIALQDGDARVALSDDITVRRVTGSVTQNIAETARRVWPLMGAELGTVLVAGFERGEAFTQYQLNRAPVMEIT